MERGLFLSMLIIKQIPDPKIGHLGFLSITINMKRRLQSPFKNLL